MGSGVRVLIVDDHALLSHSLSAFLRESEGIETVATAMSGHEALELASHEIFDVVLMDLSMPQMDGVEACRRLLRVSPDTHVVMLTSFGDRERVLQALDAGAIGYLLKEHEPDEVLRAVVAAARGESPLSPRAASAVIAARTGRQPLSELTDREREILVLVACGLSNRQISVQLAISEKTVKSHLGRLYQRLGVFDRTQAALWARSRGWV